MATEQVTKQLQQTVTSEDYAAIREMWKVHSIAEDNRDLDGLISTLTEDSVYEIVGTTHRWEGHEGARQFYLTLLGGVPDIKFELENIVIGPQGVFEEARVSGIHKEDMMGYKASGKAIKGTVGIFFPWVRKAGKFSGERIYLDLESFLNPRH